MIENERKDRTGKKKIQYKRKNDKKERKERINFRKGKKKKEVYIKEKIS